MAGSRRLDLHVTAEKQEYREEHYEIWAGWAMKTTVSPLFWRYD